MDARMDRFGSPDACIKSGIGRPSCPLLFNLQFFAHVTTAVRRGTCKRTQQLQPVGYYCLTSPSYHCVYHHLRVEPG